MKKIIIRVTHFYNHPIYYPFMSQELFEDLEIAFLNDQPVAKVPKKDFDKMISKYLDTLKN